VFELLKRNCEQVRGSFDSVKGEETKNYIEKGSNIIILPTQFHTGNPSETTHRARPLHGVPSSCNCDLLIEG
jgi:hypothetical protein